MKSKAYALVIVLFALQLPAVSKASEAELSSVVSTQLNVLFQAIQVNAPEREIDEILEQTIDFERITRGVIGSYHNKLSDTQTTRFQGVFQESMHRLLVKAASFESYDLNIERIAFRGDDRAQVRTVISTSDKQRFEIIASVGKLKSNWKVQNLIVNGVNLGLTFRNQFDNLMQKHGEPELAIDEWADSLEDPTL